MAFQRNLSFWEQDSWLEADIVIIGGGILGISTALELRERDANCSILVLERGWLPSGASTRNAGFACFAKACEMIEDIKNQGESVAVNLAWKRYEGLQKLRARLTDAEMEYQPFGGYELIRESDTLDWHEIEHLNVLLKPVFGQQVFRAADDLIKSNGFNGVKKMIYNPLEGQIHSGKMMRRLYELAIKQGIEIRTGVEVQAFEEAVDHCEISLSHAHNQGAIIKASKLIICSNAFVSRWYPDLNIKPGRGQVLVTQPIDGLAFKGSYHYDAGYYYFRNVGNQQILFGGGRNLAFEKEESYELEINTEIIEHLKQQLTEIIIPGKPIEIAHTWAGIMGFNEVKVPEVKALSSKIILGFSCNGMGVALASESAADLANRVINS